MHQNYVNHKKWSKFNPKTGKWMVNDTKINDQKSAMQDNIDLKCRKCNFEAANLKNLKRHTKSHRYFFHKCHNDGCAYEFRTLKDLRSHEEETGHGSKKLSKPSEILDKESSEDSQIMQSDSLENQENHTQSLKQIAEISENSKNFNLISARNDDKPCCSKTLTSDSLQEKKLQDLRLKIKNRLSKLMKNIEKNALKESTSSKNIDFMSCSQIISENKCQEFSKDDTIAENDFSSSSSYFSASENDEESDSSECSTGIRYIKYRRNTRLFSQEVEWSHDKCVNRNQNEQSILTNEAPKSCDLRISTQKNRSPILTRQIEKLRKKSCNENLNIIQNKLGEASEIQNLSKSNSNTSNSFESEDSSLNSKRNKIDNQCGEFKYFCKCGMRFKTIEPYNKHLKSHTRE